MKPQRKASRSLASPSMLAVVGTGIAAYWLAMTRHRTNQVPRTPVTLKPPGFDAALIPPMPQVSLEATSVDAFVQWVAATPVSDAERVRAAVAAARGDDEVARALMARLFELPARDFGRHQILLSIIGELGRPEFVEPLVKFVRLPNASIVHEPPNAASSGLCVSYFDSAAVLQSRAVEMLAWLKTPAALEAVLELASRHDSRVVRLAALDAFAFNHDDSPEALERARAAARPGEAKLVGLPRRTRDCDPDEFDAKVLAFYRQHPEERPPAPRSRGRQIRQRPPSPRATSAR